MTEERRREARKRVLYEVRWQGLSGKHMARISDLSMGGCFIDTVGRSESGEFIVFEIRQPDDSWLELRGVVASVDPKVGFSLHFTSLTEDEQRSLALLLNT